MRIIKKYANRKLYDTIDKKYISFDSLLKLIKSGEDISVVDNKTGANLTSSIISQLLVRDDESKGEVPSSLFIQLIRKGGGTIVDYAKKYSSLWQDALTMADDEIDKLINLLIKNKELSESEGKNFKKEVTGYASNLKKWIGDKIDQRINEVLSMMNLTTKEQVSNLAENIESLNQKVKKMEKLIAEKFLK